MSAVTRQRLAQRISQLLQRELGEGIDIRRMLAQELYARDVLLVCDALKGHELAELAQQFRDASDRDDEPQNSMPAPFVDSTSSQGEVTRPSIWPRTWFRSSRPGKLPRK